jgi:hypothetical protein
MPVPGVETRFFVFYHNKSVPSVAFTPSNGPLMTNLIEYLINKNAGNFLVSCENWSASQEGLCSME